MKITAISSIKYSNKQKHEISDKQRIYSNGIENVDLPNYQVAFMASVPSKIDIPLEKSRLLKELKNIFKTEIQESSVGETIIKAYNQLRQTRYKERKLDELESRTIQLVNSRFLSPEFQFAESRAILKELNKLDKKKKNQFRTTSIKTNHPKDNYIDFQLLHKFETSITDNEFNLLKIFKEYYQSMKDISTIEELQKNFPKIRVPKRPEKVIAEKLTNLLNRKFFEELDDAFISQDENQIKEILAQGINYGLSEVFKQNPKIRPEIVEALYKKISEPTALEILNRYQKIIESNSFSTIPEIRKIKSNILSENDLTLIAIDYDHFVMSVLQEQYLGFKKPNEIIVDGIKVATIRDSSYKFEKIPDKLKHIITKSQTILNAQRNYDAHTPQELKKRLEYFVDRINNNEQLLEQLVAFETCHFTLEDIKMLKLFLKELDAYHDGNKTIKEVVDYINNNDICPKGTEKLNELERRKTLAKIKAEQKKMAKLSNIQQKFDNIINILYENNMTESAEICAKYRPQSLNPQELDIANFIMNMIKHNTNPKKNNQIINIEKLEASITRWNTYFEYQNNNIDNALLIKAQKFAQDTNGKINIDKAGKYILNSEFVNNYPDSLILSQNQEIVSKIIELTGKDKEAAINYLCKLDDYNDLNLKQKTYISYITNIFDLKDSISKIILKYLVENEYINCDTNKFLTMTDKHSQKVSSTIAAKAKQEIAQYYMFPECIKYFKLFEDAMTQLAKTKATSGIKKLGSVNNTMANIHELKITGHDDRLFAYNGSFYFDEFSHKGCH